MKPIKIVVVHRNYRHKGGEDFFLENTLLPALKACPEFEVRLLRFEPIGFFEVFFMSLGLEFFRPSFFKFRKVIRSLKPHHVIFNNFIPTVSLKSPRIAKKYGAQTWAWIHNSRFFCANGLTFNGREKCEKCFTRGSRWAFFQNCHKNIFQSALYALVYRHHRVSKILGYSLDHLICVSNFTAETLKPVLTTLEHPPSVQVIRTPATVDKIKVGIEAAGRMRKLTMGLPQPFFAFVGRLSYEKGADRILTLALEKPNCGFLICGDGPMHSDLKKSATSNVAFAGFINVEEKAWVFENAEALIIPSRVPENAPLIITESQAYGTPVVYPENGGAEELIKQLSRPGQKLEDFSVSSKMKISLSSDGTISSTASFVQALKVCLKGRR